ncbi:putative amidoligase [Pseudomonas phage clash]|nr:putative amidoligase [Pseudomonas phage clash]QIQ67426.1 putative amidoligase [Pseudomonas phage otherone]
MSALYSLIGHRKRDLPEIQAHEELPAIASFGFEVELEGSDEWPRIDGWNRKEDGSLRSGMEYIFDGPSSGAEAIQRVDRFAATMEAVKPAPTFRCSTHLHMDMRDSSMDVLIKTVLTYMVFEDVFFDHCEPYRRDSNFCIPFFSNDWLAQTFGRRLLAVNEDGLRIRGLMNWPKYSALNLQTVTTFGSIEFRGSHAMTSRDEMVGLMQRMLCLKAFAQGHEGVDTSEFLEVLANVDLRDVFHLGLSPDYNMSPGGREMGLAAAALAISTGIQIANGVDPMEEEQDRQRRIREQERAEQNRRRAELTAAATTPLSFSEEGVNRFNIARTPGEVSNLGNALMTVTALRGMGYQDATVRNVFDLTDEGVAAQVVQAFVMLMTDHTNFVTRTYGVNIHQELY